MLVQHGIYRQRINDRFWVDDLLHSPCLHSSFLPSMKTLGHHKCAITDETMTLLGLEIKRRCLISIALALFVNMPLSQRRVRHGLVKSSPAICLSPLRVNVVTTMANPGL